MMDFLDIKSLVEHDFVVRSLESVPFSRYFRVCNVLRICNVRPIPTYRVCRLYDGTSVTCAPLHAHCTGAKCNTQACIWHAWRLLNIIMQTTIQRSQGVRERSKLTPCCILWTVVHITSPCISSSVLFTPANLTYHIAGNFVGANFRINDQVAVRR